ncbi:hypothetical protein L1987_33199 [Smallanthus sonchifolius]|uniref:Uncharacterized protein n=1 Tax=Smallanthus sonchifolius TaxID=185202 RepID=A0ACB9HPU9_9ASTR|nr:hypothetical protein L1987_33199 [Smallanthus sonchifolius]
MGEGDEQVEKANPNSIGHDIRTNPHICLVDISRFCYHDRLSIAVEVEKSPKPVASCVITALPVGYR